MYCLSRSHYPISLILTEFLTAYQDIEIFRRLVLSPPHKMNCSRLLSKRKQLDEEGARARVQRTLSFDRNSHWGDLQMFLFIF